MAKIIAVLVGLLSFGAAFQAPSPRWARSTQLRAAADDDSVLRPISEMKAQEIKAELELRKISYVGCFDKTDLQNLLSDARASGKCDPAILQRFNRQVAERMTGAEATPNLDEMDFEDMKAGDGSLPGGLSPAEMKKLTSNPEVTNCLDVASALSWGGAYRKFALVAL